MDILFRVLSKESHHGRIDCLGLTSLRTTQSFRLKATILPVKRVRLGM
jgi:hypothetical protein